MQKVMFVFGIKTNLLKIIQHPKISVNCTYIILVIFNIRQIFNFLKITPANPVFCLFLKLWAKTNL